MFQKRVSEYIEPCYCLFIHMLCNMLCIHMSHTYVMQGFLNVIKITLGVNVYSTEKKCGVTCEEDLYMWSIYHGISSNPIGCRFKSSHIEEDFVVLYRHNYNDRKIINFEILVEMSVLCTILYWPSDGNGPVTFMLILFMCGLEIYSDIRLTLYLRCGVYILIADR